MIKFIQLTTLVIMGIISGCAGKARVVILPQYGGSDFVVPGLIAGGTAEEVARTAEELCNKLPKSTVIFSPKLTRDLNNADQVIVDCEVTKTEATTLELKSMQTRLFKSDVPTLVGALRAYGLNNGMQCVEPGNDFIPQLGLPPEIIENNRVVCLRRFNDKFDALVESYDSVYVMVRVRRYLEIEGQVHRPEVYSDIFKRIADQLFIDAILIKPNEMR